MRGVGFRLRPGTTTFWEGGNKGAGQATINLNANPFDADGAYNYSDPNGRQVLADRYFGGDLEAATGWPKGMAAELFGFNGTALNEAFKVLAPLPVGYWEAGSWDGMATEQESNDFAYAIGSRRHPFYVEWAWFKSGDPIGKTPDKPVIVNDLTRPPGPYSEPHPVFGASAAFHYLNVRDTPAPPKPEPPKPEPPKPEPPKPTPPPASDPLAPFFSWVREWPRGLGQRAAARQFLDWASPKVSGSPVEVLAYMEGAFPSWPDNRKETVKAYLAFVRGKIGGAPPVPEPTPTPVPTPPGEGLTLYRKDGEVYNSASNPRGIISIPVPRTLRLKKLQVEMDFTRGPHNPKKPTGAIGLMWLHSKGTVRPNNWIGNLNVLPRNLKLQTKVDIAKGSGLEVETLPAILSEDSHHLSYTYDAGDRATVVIGPHALSVKSTARNGILEIPKGNLTLEIGHDVSVDGNPGTPESSSPPGWTASNLVVTGSE